MSLCAAEPAPTATELLLTRAECDQVLAKACRTAKNFQLSEFSLAPAVYTSGFLGEYYHLLVRYGIAATDENQNLAARRELFELRAFVKRLPQASVEPEKLAIFRKEAALYGSLLEHLRRYSVKSWCPQCYYARDDIIVLEHLDQLNFTLYPETHDYLSDRCLRRVLRGLAAQHASCLVLESTEGICIGDFYSQLQHEITVSAQIPWYTTGLHAILAVVKSQMKYQPFALQEAIEAHLSTAFESVYEMTNRSAKFRNVLCHRDIWRGNIFYSAIATTTSDEHEEDSVIFVDYQTARYCPPAIDLIFALYMNLDKVTRKAKATEYLSYYYDNLQRAVEAHGFQLAADISYSELLASYQQFQLFGLLYRAIATTILKVPRQYVTNEYVHVERTEMVFQLMDELPKFRYYMEECVQELLEYLIEGNKLG